MHIVLCGHKFSFGIVHLQYLNVFIIWRFENDTWSNRFLINKMVETVQRSHTYIEHNSSSIEKIVYDSNVYIWEPSFSGIRLFRHISSSNRCLKMRSHSFLNYFFLHSINHGADTVHNEPHKHDHNFFIIITKRNQFSFYISSYYLSYVFH